MKKILVMALMGISITASSFAAGFDGFDNNDKLNGHKIQALLTKDALKDQQDVSFFDAETPNNLKSKLKPDLISQAINSDVLADLQPVTQSNVSSGNSYAVDLQRILSFISVDQKGKSNLKKS